MLLWSAVALAYVTLCLETINEQCNPLNKQHSKTEKMPGITKTQVSHCTTLEVHHQNVDSAK